MLYVKSTFLIACGVQLNNGVHPPGVTIRFAYTRAKSHDHDILKALENHPKANPREIKIHKNLDFHIHIHIYI